MICAIILEKDVGIQTVVLFMVVATLLDIIASEGRVINLINHIYSVNYQE